MLPKPKWGAGPWQEEADREEFEYRGYRCLAERGPVGSWNGYVAVEHDHPAFGKHYDNLDINVHGGLTYARNAGPGLIEFMPHPTRRPDPWVIGFDTAHLGDFSPAMDTPAARLAIGLPGERSLSGHYRDLNYVKNELQEVVDELIEMEVKKTGESA